MSKSGHSFPAAAGFQGSTGKQVSVKGYTRKLAKQDRGDIGGVKKAMGGPVARPVGMSGPKMIPPAAAQSPVLTRPTAGMGIGARVQAAPIMRNPRPPMTGRMAYADGGYVKEGQGTMKTDSIGDQGNAVTKRGNPPVTEADEAYGGTGPLRTGYAKGGKTAKGHKGFNKAPLFGKK